MVDKLTKNINPIFFFPCVDNSVATAYLLVSHLKQVYRKGYLVEPRNIDADDCESVAEHCFGVAALVSLIMTSYPIALDWQKVFFWRLSMIWAK